MAAGTAAGPYPEHDWRSCEKCVGDLFANMAEMWGWETVRFYDPTDLGYPPPYRVVGLRPVRAA